MDATGLIFLVVVVAWLFYLVPSRVSRRPRPSAPEVGRPGGELSVKVHQGSPLGQDEFDLDLELDLLTNPDLPVSSELTRRARLHAISRLARRTARRRRLVLIGLLALIGLAAGLALAGLTSWWTPGLAALSLPAWAGLARWDVVRSERRLDRLRQRVEGADAEATVAIMVEIAADPAESDPADGSAWIQPSLSLWDPLPVPAQTYVSAPPAPRTVRTIDLASPLPPTEHPVVTANGDESEASDSQAV
ncbi:MAG: hypothetical protein LBJ44_06040 [Propionibacteriaceae bacterium]|jgi:hypothetical protein|nr:hypothetical protein [Propionibacteriaceae bacterium]